MQDKGFMTSEYVLFSVPVEMLEEAGIGEESIIQMSAGKGRIIIDTVKDTSDFVCDGDCESCPISEIDCDNDCLNCPCWDECDDAEVNGCE